MGAGKRFHQLSVVRLSILALVVCLTMCFLPFSADAGGKQTLGIHPYLPSTELYERFLPLAQYLGRQTGNEIDISISKTYEDHINRIGHDEVDIAYMGPALFVLMLDEYGHKPLLASPQVNGSLKVRGVIIKRDDSMVMTISDLAGKRFAFGNSYSTMGHLVPRYMLWKEGLDVSDLAMYEFLDDQENVALGVLMGVFDAGAVDVEVFEKYRDKGLAVLASDPDVAEHVFVTSSRLSTAEVEALRNALFALNTTDSGRAVLHSMDQNVTALVPVSEREYEPLRNMIHTLKNMGIEL